MTNSSPAQYQINDLFVLSCPCPALICCKKKRYPSCHHSFVNHPPLDPRLWSKPPLLRLLGHLRRNKPRERRPEHLDPLALHPALATTAA